MPPPSIGDAARAAAARGAGGPLPAAAFGRGADALRDEERRRETAEAKLLVAREYAAQKEAAIWGSAVASAGAAWKASGAVVGNALAAAGALFKGDVAGAGKAAGEALSQAGRALGLAVNTLTGGLVPALGKLLAGAGGVAGGVVGGVAAGGQAALSYTGAAVRSLSSAVALASPTHAQSLERAWEVVLARLGQALLPMVEKFAVGLQAAAAWLEKHKDTIAAVGEAFGTVMGAVVDALSIFGEALEAAADLLSGDLESFGNKVEDASQDLLNAGAALISLGNWKPYEREAVSERRMKISPAAQMQQGAGQQVDAQAFYDAMQEAALRGGESDRELLKAQLEALSRIDKTLANDAAARRAQTGRDPLF